MADIPYKLSFTVGALLVREAVIAAPLYLETRNWTMVRSLLDDDNLLQARTDSTRRRIGREVVQRLESLTEAEVALFVDSTATERGHLMWVATCRTYDLIGEFAENVLRERFLLMIPTLAPPDFDNFFHSKSLWHEELTELADSTRQRLRSNVFLMLREADLLSEIGEIAPTTLSQRVVDVLTDTNQNDFRFFPTHAAPTQESVR